ncbi:MAG: ABC transporter permease [Lachnospiraceae bacterium]|nr:ABC transporter permease [Lachnospiraceae bacterium]
MLLLIIALTTIYKLLPSRQKNTEIRVGIYMNDNSDYAESFEKNISEVNSLYSFYFTDSEEKLISDIQSGYAECGFSVPMDFFKNFIAGTNKDNKITLYVIPSTTLSYAISETFFSSVITVCSYDILTTGTELYEYKDELKSRMDDYLNGEELFKVTSATDGSYNYKTTDYIIDLHIYELIILLLIFSGLLGYYTYTKDAEENIYISLRKLDRFFLKLLYILTAILPIAFVGIICSIISSYSVSVILSILLCAIVVLISTIILSFIIKKSTYLTKVLPMIMLVAIVVVFVKSII